MKSYLLRSLGISVALVFVLNFLGVYSFWYATIWWFDMLVHFLGGVFIGFLILYLFPKIRQLSLKHLLMYVVGGVLLVGIGWEIFEVIVWYMTNSSANSFSDSISDVICDTFGGLLALSFFLHHRKM